MGSQFNAESNFQIVEFLGEISDDGKIIIEIVPSSWLTETSDGNTKGACHFPPEKDYEKLEKWVVNESLPKSSWTKFNVEILASAANYDQAQRRFKRLCKKRSNAESTDSEPETHNVRQVSKHRAASMLKCSYSLQSLNDIPEEDGSLLSVNALRPETTDVLNVGNIGPTSSSSAPRGRYTAVSLDSNSQKDGTNVIETKTEKKMSLTKHLSILRDEGKDDPLKTFFVNYLDASMDLLKHKFRDDLQSFKRSQQYDFSKKIDELKLSMISGISTAREKIPLPKTKLGVELPISSFADFLKFEKMLNQEDEANLESPDAALQKQTALKEFMELETRSSSNYQKDIKTILKALIKKDVQINYSGAGRVVKGVSKENFSATLTYACMKDFIQEKYRESKEQINVLTVTSEFLSGAGDREGGCTARKKIT